MSSTIPPSRAPGVRDFTDAEQKQVADLLLQRYARLVNLQAADSELQLDPGSADLILCPALYWSELGAQFIVVKTAAGRYRCQFFYSESEIFGTGRAEYNDLDDCVLALLRVQADHEQQRAGLFSGATGSDVDDDYHGPVVI